MQLILAIAALCQVIPTSPNYTYSPRDVGEYQDNCHKSYIHCVSVKRAAKMDTDLALEKCILEKK